MIFGCFVLVHARELEDSGPETESLEGVTSRQCSVAHDLASQTWSSVSAPDCPAGST